MQSTCRFAVPMPLLVVLGAYLLLSGMTIAWIGDAQSPDDWDFAVTALELAETGELRFSDYPSMTLVTHIGWGALFAKAFGATMLSLRVSTMTMNCLGAASLYAVASQHRVRPVPAAFFTACLLFNPLVFDLSTTFQTDVFGGSWLLISFWLIQRFGGLKDVRSVLVISAALAFGYLGRQTAAIPVLMFLAFYFYVQDRWRKRARAIAAVAIATLPIAIYYAWLYLDHGIPLGHEKAFLHFATLLQPKLLVAKTLRCLLTIGLHTVPMAVLLLTACPKPPYLRFAIVFYIGWIGASAALLTLPSLHAIRPYWNDTVTNCFLGYQPPVEDSAKLVQGGALVVFGHAMSVFDLIIVPLSVGSCLLWSRSLPRVMHWLKDAGYRCPDRRRFLIPIVILTSFANFLLLVLVWDVFDRYAVPTFTCVILLAALTLGPTRRTNTPAIAALLVMVIVTIAGVWESKTCLRLVWTEADLLVATGVDPSEISCGSAYHGLQTYRQKLEKELVKTADGELWQLSREQRKDLITPTGGHRYYFTPTPLPEDVRLKRLTVSDVFRDLVFYLVKRPQQPR